MKEKLWKEPITFEEIEAVINDYITNQKIDFQKNDLLEKWNYFAILKSETKEVIDRVLEVAGLLNDFVDSNEKKIEYLLLLVYFIGKEKLQADKMNANSIYLLLLYLNDFSITKMKSSFDYLNNEELLTKIRLKTLDVETRLKLMKYLDTLKKPMDQVVQAIDATEYYELLKVLES